LIGTVINGKEVLDGNIIEDYPLGATAPYGCGHCYLGIDYRDSQVKENGNSYKSENKDNENINDSENKPNIMINNNELIQIENNFVAGNDNSPVG